MAAAHQQTSSSSTDQTNTSTIMHTNSNNDRNCVMSMPYLAFKYIDFIMYELILVLIAPTMAAFILLICICLYYKEQREAMQILIPESVCNEMEQQLLSTTTTIIVNKKSSRKKKNNNIAANDDDVQHDDDDHCCDCKSSSSLLSSSKEEEEIGSCQICLEHYQDGDKVSSSSNSACCHTFHTKCIADWLVRSEYRSCPICRNQFIINKTAAKEAEATSNLLFMQSWREVAEFHL